MNSCPYCGGPVRPEAQFCNRCGRPLAGLQSGRYRVVRQLGKGGMGAVYLAEDRELFNRLCVIKEMLNIYVRPAERQRAEEDFRREAELLAHLNQPGHPSIPEIYGHFVEEGRHYLVMKYIAGEDLEERLQRLRRPLTEEEVLVMMAPVCDALVYMHRQRPPVIHRDIKPGNIIVGEDGRIWLVDFGLAKATLSEGALIAMKGKTMAMGTPGYTPLEQWRRSAVPGSDIYALGATMHHLLTGRDPRDRFASFAELDLTIVRSLSTWPALRLLAPSVSEEMDELVARMLLEEPAHRPTAQQVRDQLQILARDRADPLTRAIRRFGPSVSRLFGVGMASFLRRLLWGAPEEPLPPTRRLNRTSRLAPPPEEEEAAAERPTGTRRCNLCDGTGVVLGNVRCPICGGTGRW